MNRDEFIIRVAGSLARGEHTDAARLVADSVYGSPIATTAEETAEDRAIAELVRTKRELEIAKRRIAESDGIAHDCMSERDEANRQRDEVTKSLERECFHIRERDAARQGLANAIGACDALRAAVPQYLAEIATLVTERNRALSEREDAVAERDEAIARAVELRRLLDAERATLKADRKALADVTEHRDTLKTQRDELWSALLVIRVAVEKTGA